MRINHRTKSALIISYRDKLRQGRALKTRGSQTWCSSGHFSRNFVAWETKISPGDLLSNLSMAECRPHISELTTSRPMDPRRNCDGRNSTHPRQLKAWHGKRRNQDNPIVITTSQYLRSNNEEETRRKSSSVWRSSKSFTSREDSNE